MSKKTSKKKTSKKKTQANTETQTFSPKFYASDEFDNSIELMKKLKNSQLETWLYTFLENSKNRK
jgi:hypothetical protein